MAILDTIAALGTPPGISALAVVRLSGSSCMEIVRRLCPGLDRNPEPRRAMLQRARDPDTGESLDQVLVTVFPGPGSYTGEDMVEISCHGGWLSPALLLEACLRYGARGAEPGEFTRRAYLNGKMDLLQVEAVVDLIEGRSRALHGAAVHQLERGLSSRIGAIRETLVGLEALLVHHLDFPEEDEPPVPVSEIIRHARTVETLMEALLRTAPEGELLREGALTVLAGKPNSGKSSLFNALVGQERAIVTEIPGTTRDALEAVVSLGGFPFRVVDTAGLRESEERVERVGIEVARRYLEGADIVLFCVEGDRDPEPQELRFVDGVRDVPVVLVRTKMDLSEGGASEEGVRAQDPLRQRGGEMGAGGSVNGVRTGDREEGFQRFEEVLQEMKAEEDRFRGRVRVSARSGEGLDRLKELLPSLVFGGLVRQRGEVPVLTRERQTVGVRRALEEVKAFRGALEAGMPVEVASTHLRPAETALEELLGIIPREEILDRLFQDFCIGK